MKSPAEARVFQCNSPEFHTVFQNPSLTCPSASSAPLTCSFALFMSIFLSPVGSQVPMKVGPIHCLHLAFLPLPSAQLGT